MYFIMFDAEQTIGNADTIEDAREQAEAARLDPLIHTVGFISIHDEAGEIVEEINLIEA